MTCPDGVVEVPLTQGRVALVDAADAPAVLAHKWCAHREGKRFYARRQARRGDGTYYTDRIHTFLTGWPLVDHINGNGLDNRRANLRPATKSQNSQNSPTRRDNRSGYRGVQTLVGAWRARIKAGDRRIGLGTYDTPEAAARAYDEAAREHFGEFARLNFPLPGERAA